jgi:hypothetical protein
MLQRGWRYRFQSQEDFRQLLNMKHSTTARQPEAAPDRLELNTLGRVSRKASKNSAGINSKSLLPEHMAQINGLLLATLREVYAQSVIVDIADLGLQKLTARSLAGLSAADVGRSVVLGFEAGDPSRPIVLGVMLGSNQEAQTPQNEAIVDGNRVVLKAEHEIELRCGEAAIVLMADGRIELRGTYITSQASATQRILGGSVSVN